MKKIVYLLFSACLPWFTFAQDTFSIVAVDPATGEVGSAGASCISATNLAIYFPGIAPDFLGDLLPGLGAINTQSFYLAQNQQNARTRLLAGDTPQQVVDWLAANDAQGNSSQRQYGVVALINNEAQAAAFTGVNCLNFKSHRVGPNYAIQGNILLGAQILDSMESRFLAAGGCLSDRLMAALQGAKVPGADSRCLSNGTSAMFAFIKVAKPADDPANPTVRLFVSYDPVGIEPIDSLQARYDAAAPCTTPVQEADQGLEFSVRPNPASGSATIWLPAGALVQLEVLDAAGRLLEFHPAVVSGQQLELSRPGLYFIKIQDAAGNTAVRKVVVY
ncbi:MAG: DUF1028 domain-containing protein [Saprospiraceae bacterium]|nr:DUF1028 domain-containing protein [Saprospiraceae bacterium]